MLAQAHFHIDQSIGSQLTFELNYDLPDKNHDGIADTTPKLSVTFPNGKIHNEMADNKLTTFIFVFEEVMEVQLPI